MSNANANTTIADGLAANSAAPTSAPKRNQQPDRYAAGKEGLAQCENEAAALILMKTTPLHKLTADQRTAIDRVLGTNLTAAFKRADIAVKRMLNSPGTVMNRGSFVQSAAVFASVYIGADKAKLGELKATANEILGIDK